jgi:hypothetical protein
MSFFPAKAGIFHPQLADNRSPHRRPGVTVTTASEVSQLGSLLRSLGIFGPSFSSYHSPDGDTPDRFIGTDNTNYIVFEILPTGKLSHIATFADGIGGDNGAGKVLGNSRDLADSGRQSVPTLNYMRTERVNDTSRTETSTAQNAGSERYAYITGAWQRYMGPLKDTVDDLPYIWGNSSNSPYQGGRIGRIAGGDPSAIVFSAKVAEGDPYNINNGIPEKNAPGNYKSRFTFAFPEGTFDAYSASTDDVTFISWEWDGGSGTSLNAASTNIANMLPAHGSAAPQPMAFSSVFGRNVMLFADDTDDYNSFLIPFKWTGTTPALDGPMVRWTHPAGIDLKDIYWQNISANMAGRGPYLEDGRVLSTVDKWHTFTTKEVNGTTEFKFITLTLDQYLNQRIEVHFTYSIPYTGISISRVYMALNGRDCLIHMIDTPDAVYYFKDVY